MSLKNILIAMLDRHIGEVVTGTYLLSSMQEKTSNSGNDRLQLRLDDYSGSIRGVVWPENRSLCAGLLSPSPVTIEAEVRQFDGKTTLNVRRIAVADLNTIESGTRLLPERLCPIVARNALHQIVSLEDALDEPLRGFVRRVFLDPAIGVPFLRCRASVCHHHAYVGGLAVHSTAPLDAVLYSTLSALPVDCASAGLAQVAYLMHDIGKIRTVGETRRSEYGALIRHGAQSLLMLAPHLRWLEQQNPELHAGLTYVLDYIATPEKARGYAKYLVAEIVVAADQWNAASYTNRDLHALLTRPDTDFAQGRQIHIPAANDPSIGDVVSNGQ